MAKRKSVTRKSSGIIDGNVVENVELVIKDFAIPDIYAPYLRFEGDRVSVTYTVPRTIEIKLRSGAKPISVDVARFCGSVALHKLFDYGLGRYLRDGAKGEEATKNSDGKVVRRKFTEAEKITDAEVNASKKLDTLYGLREMGMRIASVSVLVREMRAAYTAFCIASLKDAKGEPFRRNTVPSSIAAGTDSDAIEKAATDIGVPSKAVTRLTQKAVAIAALREDTTGMDIEID